MVGWGGTDMIISCVKNFSALTGLRFLLGAFEAGMSESRPLLRQDLIPVAGFYPGIIYFLTLSVLFLCFGTSSADEPFV